MKSRYDILGNHIRLIDTRNIDNTTNRVMGINIDKFFMPSVANVIGTDLSKYKLITKGKFACNPMHVGRDERLPVALYEEKEPALVSPAYFMFEIIDNTILDENYLMMWFRRSEFDRICWLHTDGSVRGGITWDDICRMELPVPDISKQRETVKSYKIISDRIELKRKINDNLAKQVSSIYQAWFEDFIPFDGLCPCSWNQGSLADVAIITSGKRPPMKSTEKTDIAAIPLVGAASVMGFTTEANHTDKILVTGRVGTHGVVQRFNSPCWTSDNTLVITSNFYEYTYQILQRIDYHSMNRGSTQPLITQSDINKVAILIPDQKVLKRFETLAGQLMAQYEANLLENSKLAELRDFLLTKLLSDEFNVSNIGY